MTNEEKEKIIRHYISAYNRFDVEGMVAFLHSEIVFMNVLQEEVTAQTEGIEAFTSLANQAKEVFSDRHQKPIQFKFDGDKTVVAVAFKGTLANDLPNGMSKGEEIKLSGTSEFEFKENKITKITDFS